MDAHKKRIDFRDNAKHQKRPIAQVAHRSNSAKMAARSKTSLRGRHRGIFDDGHFHCLGSRRLWIEHPVKGWPVEARVYEWIREIDVAKESARTRDTGPSWPADSVERREVASLVPHARNARTHSPEQIEQIARSMTEFGFTNPVLLDEDGGIIAGHGRVLAAKKLGIVDIPCMVARGWSDAQKRAYLIADNAIALNAGWDEALLKIEFAELKAIDFDLTLTGFTLDAIGAVMASGSGGLTDPDEVPEPPVTPLSRLGDVWLLGRHRLACGDSTDADCVARVLAGTKPHLMVTDPPFGVKLNPRWRDNTGANTKGKSGKGGQDYMSGGKTDIEARWDGVWALFPGDVCYVWCASSGIVEVHQALSDAGLLPHQILVWDKDALTLTRTHYWYTHELCIYGWRKGATAHWIGKAGQATVWAIPSPKHIMGGSKEKNEPHPAQKPVECMRRPIENNSKPGDAVYEPFSGSGTTIIAGEMTGRRVLAIEISPIYVDVAVERWQNFTGNSAVHEKTGKTFAEVTAGRSEAVAA